MPEIIFGSSDPEVAALRSKLEPLEEGLRKDDWKVMAILGLVVFVCTAVIAPYRNIHLPKELMFAVGVCLSFLCVPMVLQGHDKLILMLLTYMPFSKVVPGTFGGLIRTFNATNILLMLIIIGWAVYHGMQQKPLYRREKLDPYLGMFLFLAVISLIRGFVIAERQHPLDAIFAMKRWLTPMFIYIIITNNLPTKRHGLLALYSIMATTGIIGLLGLKEFYVDHGARSTMEKSRISVTSGSNHLGFLLCSCVFFLVAMWWVNRRDKRYWLLLIPIMACIQSMRLTFSRGAQVGLVFGFLYFVYLNSKKAFAACVFVVVLVAFNPGILPTSIMGRLATTYVDTGTGEKKLDKSANSRLVIWKGALRIVRKYPILGIGYHNFRRQIGDYAPTVAFKDAHSTYFIIASEMGAPALIFFLLVMFFGWRSGKFVYDNSGDDRVMRYASLGYLSMFVAMLVSNIFGSRFDSSEVTVQFYASTGVMVCFEHILRTRMQLKQREQEVAKDGEGRTFRPNPFRNVSA